MNVNPNCESSGYNNGTGGNFKCALYFAVQCDIPQCAYKLKLTVFDNNTVDPSNTPRYLVSD